MKKITFCILGTVLLFKLQAQISPANFIDTAVETAGITKIISSDLNNDGFNDIITSSTGTNGRLGFYNNLTNQTFSAFNSIETFEFCRGTAAGNFNNDNLIDFVAIGKVTNEVKIFINNNGSYTTSIIDSHNMILNDVIVADFDQNNFDDIVVIGQHSIDFYRNNGNSQFNKEIILSTSTSPLVLECLDIATKDMDNDGDLDIISGETAGLVVYINNGNAVFSPNYYSIIPEVFFLVHPIDIDNDGDFDVVGRNGAGKVKWFANNGNGNMTYQATLTSIPNIISLDSNDYNGDGWQDLYVSYTNTIAIFANDATHNFNTSINMYHNTGLNMGKVAIANINNDASLDYVWSGGNNALAYHLNQSVLSLDKEELNNFIIFPNPTNGILNISVQVEKLTLYNLIGEKLLENNNSNSINLSNLSDGIYILRIENKGKSSFKKISKK